MLMKNIAIYPSEPNLKETAHHLGLTLNLPVVSTQDPSYAYLLLITPAYLGLQKMDSKANPLIIDFFAKPLQYRAHSASIKKETLARALGLKPRTTPKIIDATAGLGRDSFLVASLGFEIDMIERSPIIHALLKDALARAGAHPAASRMHLQHSNAITWLEACHEKPDIIYLDPMFSERKKSALPKQNMMIFHDIVGDDLDATALLSAALACATRRVVVKRSRLAAEIAGVSAPSFSLTGSSSRFDVYLI